VADAMIHVVDLGRSYGTTVALDGVDLVVPTGTVMGLLGPNGAGKTTLVRILATLLRPDRGRARIDGIDVVHGADEVRRRIGLAGQHAAVDDVLTGEENLRMVAMLYGLRRREADRRAGEVLERLGLTAVARRAVRTYSGGMRRRLDLGASLVGGPRVLLLDEPTTGLDPASRLDLWEFIAQLVREGTTVLLTTQYLEEADELADRITVIDRGQAIAQGTPNELKSRLGGDVVEVHLQDRIDLTFAARLLDDVARVGVQVDERRAVVSVPVGDRRGVDVLADAVQRLDAQRVPTIDLTIRRPSLDDVFLHLVGRSDPGEPRPDRHAATDDRIAAR
jgi:ABC-2 type transport system ATP-binding protein